MIAGCSFVREKAEAEQSAQAFFEDRITHGGIGREPFYSEFFWKRTRKEKREYLQQMVLIALGNLKEYSLHSWKAQNKMGSGKTGGITVMLIYDTKYQRGEGQEIITLYKNETAAAFLIMDHKIQSTQLEKLLKSGIDLTPREV